MARKTKKPKTKQQAKSAAKPRAVAKKPAPRPKPRRPRRKEVGWADTGALTQRAHAHDAAIAPVPSFADLVGYWDVLLDVYRVVAIEAQALLEGVLSFKILHPDTGEPFNKGEVFGVRLTDGQKTYPGFPATGHLIDPSTEFKFGYLLLSREWLDVRLGSKVAEYSGPKRPVGASL